MKKSGVQAAAWARAGFPSLFSVNALERNGEFIAASSCLCVWSRSNSKLLNGEGGQASGCNG